MMARITLLSASARLASMSQQPTSQPSSATHRLRTSPRRRHPARLAMPGGAGFACSASSARRTPRQHIIRDGIVIPWDDTPRLALQQQASVESTRLVLSPLNGSGKAFPLIHHFLYTADDAMRRPTMTTPARCLPTQVRSLPGAVSAAIFKQNSDGTQSTFSHALVGNHVIVVAIDRTIAPATNVTEALLTSQVSCFLAGDCLAPVAPSPELLQAAT